MSEVWTTHEALWSDLDAEDAALVAEAQSNWRDLQDAVGRAANGAASLRDAVVRFAGTSDARSEAPPPASQAQDGLRAALTELDGLAGRYRETLAEVETRLKGSNPLPRS
jgi:hypothetical protein